MPSDKTNSPFNNSIDNTKWEKLLDIAKNLDNKNSKKIEKQILKEIPSKYHKSLFIILTAIYLETGFIKWDNIRNKISSLGNISKIKKTGLFQIFSSKKKSKSDKEEYAQMYINIGKDKNIFPNHLIQFIYQSMKIRSDQIKNIHIFEKYSFFSIPKSYADKAIILLSVKRFRGKIINVNYSKQSIPQ